MYWPKWKRKKCNLPTNHSSYLINSPSTDAATRTSLRPPTSGGGFNPVGLRRSRCCNWLPTDRTTELAVCEMRVGWLRCGHAPMCSWEIASVCGTIHVPFREQCARKHNEHTRSTAGSQTICDVMRVRSCFSVFSCDAPTQTHKNNHRHVPVSLVEYLRVYDLFTLQLSTALCCDAKRGFVLANSVKFLECIQTIRILVPVGALEQSRGALVGFCCQLSKLCARRR